jgi:putative membrane protein
MSPEVQAFASGFPIMLLHAGMSLVLLAAACGGYALLSPHREVQRIREGNAAAAVSLASVVLGLAIPLAASLAAAASFLEIVLWGLAVSALALLAFSLIDLGLAGLPERMREGDTPAAVVLAAAKLGVSLILAAALAV